MKKIILILLVGLMVFTISDSVLASCGVDDLYMDNKTIGSKTIIYVNPYKWAVQCTYDEKVRLAKASITVIGNTTIYFMNGYNTSIELGTYINGILVDNVQIDMDKIRKRLHR